MARSSSPSSGKKPLGLTYRFDADTAPAILAVAQLLHGGTLVRVAEDAIDESLIARGFLDSALKAADMPTVESLTDIHRSLAAQDDLASLLEAMGSRLLGGSGKTYNLRAVTKNALAKAIENFPKPVAFAWPAAKKLEQLPRTDLPLRLHVHPRTEIGLRDWTEENKKRSPKASISASIQEALREKLSNLGVDAGDYYADEKKVLKRPVWKKLPHPDVTFATRSLEERALAVLAALEALSAAGAKHGYTPTLSPRLRGAAERFLSAADHATFEES